MTEAEKTDADLEALLTAWKSATPEAQRIFAETHFCLDAWPAAEGLRECDAFNRSRWSRK